MGREKLKIHRREARDSGVVKVSVSELPRKENAETRRVKKNVGAG